jgi:hypothetical protein
MRRFRNSRIRALLYAGRPNWTLLDTLTHPEIRRARLLPTVQVSDQATAAPQASNHHDIANA